MVVPKGGGEKLGNELSEKKKKSQPGGRGEGGEASFQKVIIG